MDNTKLVNALKEIKLEIEQLKQRRTYQLDLSPSSVKVRHYSEGNPWAYGGLEADLPTEGAMVTSSFSIYWAYDTGKLYLWDGTAWLSATFT